MENFGRKRIVFLFAFFVAFVLAQMAAQSDGGSVDSKYDTIERKRVDHTLLFRNDRWEQDTEWHRPYSL